MRKQFSFKSYAFNLKDTMVADKLLGIFHVIVQVLTALSLLISGFAAFQWGFFHGLGTLILMIVLIPIASVLVRFWFEMIAVLFSINGNLFDIKKEMCGACTCEDCDCEEKTKKVK